MGKIEAARESYLAAAHELQATVDSFGSIESAPESARSTIEALGTRVDATRKQWLALREAGGSAGNPHPLRDMSGNAMPWPGGGAAPSSGPAWSIGSAFIQERHSRQQFGAGILDPGSTAVAVPLSSVPLVDPRQASFVYQLLGQADAPNGVFSYLKQASRILRAAVVAPGAIKPTSTMTLQRVEDTTKVIAHLTDPVSRFDVMDAPLLRQFIDAELILGLDLAIDRRVVHALMDEATEGVGSMNLSGIRTAITALELLNDPPTAIVMNPTVWQAIEAEAIDTFAANSNLPAATEAMNRRLYGLPVAVAPVMSAAGVLVGNFASATLFVTGGVQIDVSDSTPRTVDAVSTTDFQVNQLVLRAERRAEVAIGRPASFVMVGSGS